MAIDPSKLLRKPFTEKGNIQDDKYDVVKSPDDKWKIVFSHYREPRMGDCHRLFSLLDKDDNIIDLFEPLVGIAAYHCCWTSDSKYFAVATIIYGSGDYGYFVVKIPSFEYAFIKIGNPYPLDNSFEKNVFRLSYNDKQVELSNSRFLIGGGISDIPKKKYLKPEDLVFNLSDLHFYNRSRLFELTSLIKEDKLFNLTLINAGFFEYTGLLPQDTVNGHNGRGFGVYQLVAFAEYGDKVSQFWLEEIKRIANNKFNLWVKVSDYIGYRTREADEKLITS